MSRGGGRIVVGSAQRKRGALKKLTELVSRHTDGYTMFRDDDGRDILRVIIEDEDEPFGSLYEDFVVTLKRIKKGQLEEKQMLNDLIMQLGNSTTDKEKEVVYKQLEKLGMDRVSANILVDEMCSFFVFSTKQGEDIYRTTVLTKAVAKFRLKMNHHNDEEYLAIGVTRGSRAIDIYGLYGGKHAPCKDNEKTKTIPQATYDSYIAQIKTLLE